MTPKKPVGVNGPVQLSATASHFQQLVYPQTKEEIELFIAQSFMASPIPGELQISSIEPQQQNGFDFHATTNSGVLNLELMEIAPLENLRGSYASAPSQYKPYDFAQYIYGKAMKKSSRYVGKKSPRIVLLVYVTNWSFILSESVVCLLQYWLQSDPHNFEQVYVHHPVEPGFGFTSLLFPTPAAHWKNFDPATLKDNVVQNLSPLEWKCGG